MLPPVRATLSLSADNHPPQPQPPLRQTINNINGLSRSPPKEMPGSAGRLNFPSVPAEIQFAQGFSVFAETIGKLIKVPRREGENVADYGRRLMEIVRSMSPAQQVSLERALNQLVKGISLRLLTDILNNPSGPDAARFAVRLETAQLPDRDLAARAVVSSYRQNAGRELSSAMTPTRYATPAAGGPTSAAGQGLFRPSQDPSTGNRTFVDAPDLLPGAGGQKRVSSDSARPAVDGRMAPQSVRLPLPAARDVAQQASQRTSANPVPSIAGAVGDPAGAENDRFPVPGPSESSRTSRTVAYKDGDPARRLINATDAWEQSLASTRSERPNGGERLRQGYGSARATSRSLEERPGRQPDAGRFGLPGISAWLTEVFADESGDLVRPSAAASKDLPQRTLLEGKPGHAPREDARISTEVGRTATGEKPIGQVTDVFEEGTVRDIGPATSSISRPAAASPGTLEQIVPPLIPQIPREGLAVPYIPYPAEEREPDREERKTKAVIPTDEDGERPSSQGQEFDKDRSHEEEPPAPEEQSGDDEGDDQRANDLYWRMAGWN